jgi:hypothetical protein
LYSQIVGYAHDVHDVPYAGRFAGHSATYGVPSRVHDPTSHRYVLLDGALGGRDSHVSA